MRHDDGFNRFNICLGNFDAGDQLLQLGYLFLGLVLLLLNFFLNDWLSLINSYLNLINILALHFSSLDMFDCIEEFGGDTFLQKFILRLIELLSSFMLWLDFLDFLRNLLNGLRSRFHDGLSHRLFDSLNNGLNLGLYDSFSSGLCDWLANMFMNRLLDQIERNQLVDVPH